MKVKFADFMSLLEVNQVNYHHREKDQGPNPGRDCGHSKKIIIMMVVLHKKNDQQYKKKGENRELCIAHVPADHQSI